MAQYRGTTISKLGNKTTGLDATVNGWNIGCKVYLSYNEETGKDVLDIYVTGGSNNSKENRKGLIYSSDVMEVNI